MLAFAKGWRGETDHRREGTAEVEASFTPLDRELGPTRAPAGGAWVWVGGVAGWFRIWEVPPERAPYPHWRIWS